MTTQEPCSKASYFAYEMVTVFPPHVCVSCHIQTHGLKCSQHACVWQDKEGCTFSMSEQAAQELCRYRNKDSAGLCFTVYVII